MGPAAGEDPDLIWALRKSFYEALWSKIRKAAVIRIYCSLGPKINLTMSFDIENKHRRADENRA